MTPIPKLDGAGFLGKIRGMIRRFISGAMRSSIEELLSQPINDIKKDVGRITEDIGELKAGQARLEIRLDDTNKQIAVLGARLDTKIDGLAARLDSRIDGLDTKIVSLGARLDGRIDGLDTKIDGLAATLDSSINGLDKKIGELTTQQSRIVEEVLGLKRDQKSADVVERRLTRIEDRLFARAS